jgi:hypothetical protein
LYSRSTYHLLSPDAVVDGGGLLVSVPELLEGLHLVVPPVAVLCGGAPLLPTFLTHLRNMFD